MGRERNASTNEREGRQWEKKTPTRGRRFLRYGIEKAARDLILELFNAQRRKDSAPSFEVTSEFVHVATDLDRTRISAKLAHVDEFFEFREA